MNLWLCFWLGTLGSTIGLSTHWQHLFPLAAGCLTVLFLAMMLGIRGRRTNSRITRNNSPTMTKESPSSKIEEKGHGEAKYAAIWTAMFFGAACLFIGWNLGQAPVVEKHNVQVVKKVDHLNWWMVDDQGPFLYTACDDFPNEDVIWAGYIARKVRWQEFGKCKSIRRGDLGFWWDRDSDFNVKEIAHERAAR